MEDVATRTSRIGIAAGLWLLQLVVAAIAYAHMFLSQFSVASCTANSCDYSAYAATINAFNIGTLVLLAASGIGIFVLRRKAWGVIWPPILGTTLTVSLLIVTYALSRAALDLPLFGNRL